MSHVTKIFLRILLLRARSRITPEIGIEQFGFVEDTGTRNAIFVLRVITERAVEMQKDVFMCFINYIKAVGPIAFICTDKGLSSTDGENWITYKKNDNNNNGKVIITKGIEKTELTMSSSISHNYILGVDAKDDIIWLATSKGVSRGELMK